MTQRLTILRGRGAATKSVTRREDGSYHFTPYSAGKWFEWREAPAAGIADLARVIEGLGTHDFLIRGTIHDDVRGSAELTRQLVNFGGQDGATPCQWAMFDLDKVPENPALDLYEEPEDVAEWLISEYLPSLFHDVSCYWQFSSSAGITPGLSAHLFFWLDRPIPGGDLKHYLAAHAPAVDLAPIRNDVQPHYVAPPIFSNRPDPLPRRGGLMVREHAFASLPQIDRQELRQYAIEHSGAPIRARGFRENLRLIGDGDGLGRFHEPIRSAIMWAVRDARGPLDERQIKAEVREAIRHAPKAPDRDPSNYLGDEYLDSSISGALRRRQRELIKLDRPSGEARVPLQKGEARLGEAVEAFMSALPAGGAPVHAIAAEAGLGKTEAVLKQISRLLRDDPVQRVHFYIDTHRLGEEIADRYERFLEEPDPPARIHRGRDRDELAPDGQPMCFDDMRDKARAFDEAGVSVSEHLCPHCPHLGKCGWSRQKQDKGPGLVIMPANYAFEDSAQRADIQIFDESFWQTALVTQKVNLGELMVPLPNLPHRGGGRLAKAMEERLVLDRARAALQAALRDADNGVPSLAQLKAAGVDATMARQAKGLEYRRAESINNKVTHTMSAAEIRHATARFEHAGARQWGALWRSIEEQIELDRERIHGWRRWVETKDDATVPWLLLRTCRELRGGAIPTLFLDATADETILRRFAPGLSEVTRIAVELGAVRVTQITDTPMGKNKIAPAENETAKDNHLRPDEEKRKRNNARKLARLTEVAAAGRKSVGLVTYKATEEEIADILPANVTTGHFNGTRGRNLWEDTDAFFIAGRPQPSEDETEWLAEALFWKDPVQITPGRFGETASGYITREREVYAEAVAHPDPIVEAVRWQICEGELVQNFARPRPIRRGRDRPVEIFILSNVPVPVPVDRLTTWGELVPDRLEVVAARGVVLDNNADLARAYPDLFKTAKAAEKAAEHGRYSLAGRSPPFPYNKSSIGKRGTPPTEVRYQLAGKGQKPKTAYYCPAQVADIRAWLTDKLGALASFEASGMESAAPPVSQEAESGADPPLETWNGGHLTADQVLWARERLKSTGQTQDDVASAAGVSRPQLTNALRGRFGLSENAARRVYETLSALPVVQPGLGFP